MLKLIASDLDGTLLDGEGNLPEEIFAEIDALSRLGILFAAASGRQYANLKKLFAPVADKIVFICENGALVKYREETLHLCPVPPREIKRALDEIRAIPHAYPILCGAETAYIESADEPFYSVTTAAYSNCAVVDSLDKFVGKEPVCKISVFDEPGAANNCFLALPPKLPTLRTALSGRRWCDVSSPLVDKGVAMRKVQEYFRLQKDECAAFGDHMNDLEMLLACGTAYVPENAYPALKEKIKRTVPANTEGGVVQKIKEIIEENAT